MATRLTRREFLQRSALASAAAASGALASPGTVRAEQQADTFFAFSFKAAERLSRRAGRRLETVVARLGHLNHITGLIVDPQSRDCILIGQRDPALPEFRLDDLVVMFVHCALMEGGTAYLRAAQAAACARGGQAGCTRCKPQREKLVPITEAYTTNLDPRSPVVSAHVRGKRGPAGPLTAFLQARPTDLTYGPTMGASSLPPGYRIG